MKWLTGHQPNYLPYPGLFSKIIRADVFMIVDHVQFRKSSDHMRNWIHGEDGPLLLGLPTHAAYKSRICDVDLSKGRKNLDKHWLSIESTYKDYPHYSQYANGLKAIYQTDYEKLSVLNIAIIRHLLEALEIDRPVHVTSEFFTDWGAKKNDMILHGCESLGCTGFISGMGAKGYIIEEKFHEVGRRHLFDEYKPISYLTPRGPSLPNMSVVDALFSIGPDETKKKIREHHV
jgi:hypothetical protein